MRIAFIATAVAAILIAGSPARADADGGDADLVLASVPEVPDASTVFAFAVQEGVTVALDSSLFVDPNERETEMLIAQDFSSLRAETTASIVAAAEIPVAEEVGLSDGTDVLP